MGHSNMRCFQISAFGEPPIQQSQAVPVPTGTEILVQVKGAGVCHSDLHIMDGYQDMGSGRKVSYGDRMTLPITLGHETAGEVAGVGPDVQDVELGSSVLVHPWVGCDACDICLSGRENMCPNSRFIGFFRDGGFADYVLVPHPKYVIALGDLDPVEAAPLACSGITTYSALKKFDEDLSQTPVVIVGAGGLGLMALGVLQMMGGKGGVVIEPDAARRASAMAAGALAAIDPAAADAAQQIRAAVGQPIRSILDLVGNTSSLNNALGLIDKPGKIIVVGLMGGDINLPVPLLPLRALTLQGSYVGSPAEMRELIELVKQHGLPRIPVSRRPLSEAAEALADLRHGRFVGRFVLVP